jgi:hypothetical protein
MINDLAGIDISAGTQGRGGILQHHRLAGPTRTAQDNEFVVHGTISHVIEGGRPITEIVSGAIS